MSNFLNLIPFSMMNREIIAQVTETKNSTSGFQAYTATSPIYFVFQRGKKFDMNLFLILFLGVIYFKTKMKLFGEPYSQATLKFLGIEASSSILKVFYINLNNIKIKRLQEF